MDKSEMLVEQAHSLFGETSIFEVFDLPNRQEVIQTLTEFYGLVDVGKVDRYLSILDQLRIENGEVRSAD